MRTLVQPQASSSTATAAESSHQMAASLLKATRQCASDANLLQTRLSSVAQSDIGHEAAATLQMAMVAVNIAQQAMTEALEATDALTCDTTGEQL